MRSLLPIFLITVITLTQCTTAKKDNSAEAIYLSGKFDSNIFILKGRNNRALVDTYLYKQDTFLQAQLHYWNNRKEFSGFSFYYHGKAEGRWLLYRQDSSLAGEVNYKNGKENGTSTVYDHDVLKTKWMYVEGRLVYEINYDSTGKIIDSTLNRE